MVVRFRKDLPRDCPSAVELQSSCDNARSRGVSGRALECHSTRTDDCAGCQRRSRSRVAHRAALELKNERNTPQERAVKNIFIGNLDVTTTEHQLRELFQS